jgi:hypothetical protein
MKRLLMAIVIWVGSAGFCLAQQASGGEMQGFYQRVQSFTFRDPAIGLDISGQTFNGGGFGFVFNITEKFALYQQTGFFGGVGQDGLNIRLITEFQGMQMTKHTGRADFFVKGGVGFARYVFSGALSGVNYNMAFQYGGGTEIKLKPSLYLLIEVTGLSMTVPNLTDSQDRSKWNTSFLIGPGISIHF